MSPDAPAPLVVYLVSEDWYFWSHRLNVARAARDAGCRVAVATRVHAHGERIVEEGFTLLPVPLERGRVAPLADLRYTLAVFGVYRRHRPSLVHHVAMKPVLFGTLAARLAGVPGIVNALAGLGFLFASSGGPARWLRALVRLAFRVLLNGPRQRVVVQNLDDRAELARLVRPERVLLVPGSGVDTDRLRSLPAPAPGAPVVFAMVSRMLREKGVADFVEAARALRAAGDDVRLVLVGRPDTGNPNSCTVAELEAWAAEGCIEWWGHREDIVEVWRQADVCVLPSYYREGVPKALLEAAACGRPIVTTDTPGCRDVVVDGENGLLVPARDVSALAAAMRRLARDGAMRRRMGERGRRRVEAGFSEQRVVGEMLAVYRELMGSRWPS